MPREDARRRQEIELRNQADALVYSTERALAEHGAKLCDTDRPCGRAGADEAREALEGGDIERIRARPGRPDARGPALADGDASPGWRRRAEAPRRRAGRTAGDVVDAEFKDADDPKSVKEGSMDACV